jgi:hypothetical protein
MTAEKKKKKRKRRKKKQKKKRKAEEPAIALQSATLHRGYVFAVVFSGSAMHVALVVANVNVKKTQKK